MIVIPYSVKELSREKAFTQEMERAAILCLSEVKRRKPSILRGSAEETEYIAKLNYPLWAVPWRGKCIVADGLGLVSTTISYNQIPSVLDFTENLKRSSTSFSIFKKTLEENEHAFEGFASAEKVELNGMISDNSTLEALSHFIDQAKPQKEVPETAVVAVPIAYDEKKVENITEHFLNKWQRLQTDVGGLRFALQVLREETEHHREKASVELELIWGSYENRISEVKKDVDKKVRQLDKEKVKESATAEKLIEKQIRRLDSEKKKLHQRNNELKRSLDAILIQKKVQKRKYPKRSTTRIDNKIFLFQERIKQVNSEFRHITDLQEQSRNKGQQELKRIEERYLNLAAKEMEKLEILEQSRNLEMTGKRKELKETEDFSSKIEGQIENLIGQKNKDMKTLENMTIQLEAEETLLIWIPFYVIQYRLLEKTRTDLYPPMTVASYEGILKRIQKAIFSFSLEARMQLLLNPRSPNLNETIFTNLQKRLSTDSTLKEQVTEAAFSVNLLAQPGFREQIDKGLAELESEGWLNSKEKENILSIVIHE
jgi:hypothetical protein